MEKLMQYIWQHRLLKPGTLTTVDNRRVDIIDPGRLNTDAGPDFFNAKVRIGGRMWAGNVEIHVRASDWMRHGHHTDAAYDSVILHVVDMDDTMVRRSNGEVIPQMRLSAAADFASRYNSLVARADTGLPCREFIATMPSVHVSDWITALGMERLYNKTERIEGLLARYNGDWREVTYVTLARALGFGINAEPFERLAVATPFRFLAKHADSLPIIEAALFGQSGLLDNAPADCGYAATLRREYDFMRSKFGLHAPQGLGWKMGRMRPQNFPHRRIALLASIVASMQPILSEILEATTAEEAMRPFQIALTGFWATHYTFAPSLPPSGGGPQCCLSASSLRGLLINVVVPLIHAWSRRRGDEEGCHRAVAMLQDTVSESNSIVSLFGDAGVRSTDAFTSQALIELRRQYCEARKCLYCRIGHRMLSHHAVRPASR